MEKDHLSRKLAVILHADVVGSTELVQINESIAHERIQSVFRHFSETIKVYGGTTRELRGDALVAEFGRASDAVSAALAFQVQNGEINAELDDNIQPQLRIGISMGEVIVADNTVTGASVVLSQRIEQLADPGGVVVQGSVSETVPTRLPFEFESFGEQTLKGFDHPVRCFIVKLKPGGLIPDPESNGVTLEIDAGIDRQKEPLNLPDKPSIAVLPFTNMSDDSEQEYFADGMVEDIITALSRFHGLFVIARNSSFTYKGRSVDVKQVGRELGVRYVLEGSVRKSGNRVRITCQLIDAGTGAHIWADRFDGSLEDVFDLQEEVSATVVGAIAPKLERAEIERSRRKPTEILSAYDFYLRGMAAMHLMSREGSEEALANFSKAIQLDPRFAAAYGMGARCYAMRKMARWMKDIAQESVEAEKLARQAVELGPDDEIALCTAAFAINDFANEFAVADALTERALALNPNLAWAWLFSGWVKISLGDTDLAIERLERAIRLSPQDPQIYSMQSAIACAQFVASHYTEALSMAETAMREQPNVILPVCIAVASAVFAKRVDKTERLLSCLFQLAPEISTSSLKDMFSYLRPNDFERLVKGMREAGLPG
jgi:TolB-like protein/class 3 adenylate cyclase/Tfp pilus assembly protein PilF